MSLTKKDKEEIRAMFREFQNGQATDLETRVLEQLQDMAVELPDQYPNFNAWRENGIKSKLTGLIIAPDDFWVKTEKGTKRFFTWDEAKQYEKDILIPNGWRLPTTKEWVLLYGEFGFGADETNGDGKLFAEALGLERSGRITCEDMDDYNANLDSSDNTVNQGTDGYFWSAGANSPTYARYLGFYGSYVWPEGLSYKSSGISVRCIAQ